jgi:hypothetical protein
VPERSYDGRRDGRRDPAPDRKITGRIGTEGGTTGVYVLADDDPAWQETVRRRLNGGKGDPSGS